MRRKIIHSGCSEHDVWFVINHMQKKTQFIFAIHTYYLCIKRCSTTYIRETVRKKIYVGKICLTGNTIRRIDIVSRCLEKKHNNCCETKFIKMPFIYYLQNKSISGYSSAWIFWHQGGQIMDL